MKPPCCKKWQLLTGGLLLLLVLLASQESVLAWENYTVSNIPVYLQAIEPGNILIVNKRNRNDSGNFAVRFYGIGIPTHSQPFGGEAAREIAELLPIGSRILISSVRKDEQGLVTALVQRNDRSINSLLVEKGLAWVDRSTCKAFLCRRWHIQESLAVKSRTGIWSLKLSSPPWQWGSS